MWFKGHKPYSENDCSTECQNGRITSEAVIHCDSLVVRQDLCVSSLVGASEDDNPEVLQVDTTIFSLPADPIRPALLLSVIAQNVSENPVDVQILSSDLEDILTEATVAPNSEVALSAPNAAQLIASAAAPSRVRFFITVFLPGDPIAPSDPI